MSEYTVVVEFVVQADAEDEVLRLYGGPFKEAISAQEGFRSVSLLKPTDGQSHLLIIQFYEQSLQEQWVSTDLHAKVWSKMEATFSSYQVRSFHSLQS